MGLHRWLGAILLASVLGLTGCGQKPRPDGSTPSSNNTPATVATTTAPTTPVAVETTAAPAASESPAASGSPVAAASGSPAAAGTPGAAGAVEEDYANAEGMAGYEEVLALTAPPSTPDSIAKGKEVFAGAGNCVSCHGAEGKGDGPAGKALDPPPRNMHAKADYKYGAGPHGIYRTVYYGIEGTGMAPLEGVLTPEQIWNVVHYVETLEGT